MAKHSIGRESSQYARVAMLGLAGVCVVCVTQILTLPTLDQCLKLALGGFALGLPSLTAAGMMHEGLLGYSSVTWPAVWISSVTTLLGCLGVIWGLTLVFWHFHWFFGALFLLVSVSSLAAMFRFHAHLETGGDRVTPNEIKPSAGANR
jgi:hypothetical protein